LEQHTREINAAVCVIWSYGQWWWRSMYCKITVRGGRCTCLSL